MNRSYKYEQGGNTGDPKPPSWIANDPKFSNVTFLGANYEDKLNRASGFGGEDFRFDLNGVKFYGMYDDGFTFVDENGNGWSAERDYQTGNPDDDGGGYADMFEYLKDLGATYSEEYQDIVKAADEKKRSEPKGRVGTIIHKNNIITGSGDPRGEIIDLREGREDLRPGQLRRGLKELQKDKKRDEERFEGEMYEQGGATSKGKPNLVLPRESEGEVRQTEDGREYVMYRNEDTGEMVKVFGSWNEAPRVRERDEQGMGRFMSIDTSFNYPVTQNENGEFILDEAMLDTEQEGDGPKMVYDEKMGRKMPVAPVGNLLRQLEQQGPGYSGVDKFSPTVRRGINMRNGGRTYRFD